ncbi:acyl-CoA thioesterase [Alteribacter natronophilus]|uniref:acyl-CoA thioesterase n=1 Tax=Alteribacter natronophilus TaxID=2583810 RepID=UPI00110E8E0C|nr:thioesterase family protein [Alteribacter natronophilus]TMW71637.1 acyl-CoA thioesterase [Alteribacter natronophilus]
MALPDYIEDLEKWQSEFSHSYPVTVRFSETDAFGHLNNTVSFVYFEQGRINFFKDIGFGEEWFAKGGEGIPVTADLHCDYKRQVFFDENLEVHVKVAGIGNSSIDLHYLITNEAGKVCMTGRGRMVQVSRTSGKPLSWSKAALEKLEASQAIAG